MRDIEKRSADAGIPWQVLMDNAGLEFALAIKRIAGDIAGCPVVFLIGPGNNGGDGLVAARHLHDWGATVHLYLCAARNPEDHNFVLTRQRNIPFTEMTEDRDLAILHTALSSAQVVVDAVLGTGKMRSIEGSLKEVLSSVSRVKAENPDLIIAAVDLPTGLDADSGACDPSCLIVDITVTFGFPKVGFFAFPAYNRIGQLVVADIGLLPELSEDVSTEVITPSWMKTELPSRPDDAHKGTFGKVMVVAGSINYIGAAYLACTAALRVGAGLVTLATARSLQPILASKLTEVTYLPLPENEPGIISAEAASVIRQGLKEYDVLLIGCGLGQSTSAAACVSSLLFSLPSSVTAVIDADALNILATIPHWWKKIKVDAVLTPHLGEMARLTGLSAKELQQDRLSMARRFSAKWNEIVVLKGAHSLVASPDGQVKLNFSANAGLASAGTGDVLAGAVAGLLAQGISPVNAAACGVYLHADAAESVEEELGNAGMIASDLLIQLPVSIKKMHQGLI